MDNPSREQGPDPCPAGFPAVRSQRARRPAGRALGGRRSRDRAERQPPGGDGRPGTGGIPAVRRDRRAGLISVWPACSVHPRRPAWVAMNQAEYASALRERAASSRRRPARLAAGPVRAALPASSSPATRRGKRRRRGWPRPGAPLPHPSCQTTQATMARLTLRRSMLNSRAMARRLWPARCQSRIVCSRSGAGGNTAGTSDATSERSWCSSAAATGSPRSWTRAGTSSPG